MIKIYFNHKPLFLTSQITKKMEELLHPKETVFIEEFNLDAVKKMIHEMESSKIGAGIFLHHNVDELLNAFKKELTFIQAAGGLVYAENDEILLIFRRGKWDLPKGKIEEGENMEQCAVREIEEETGIQNLKIEKPLCITYHTYHQDEKHILKEAHWFLINTRKQTNFLPQLEEDIEKCEWVAIDKLASFLENTHASILDVVNAGIKILQETKNV